MPSCSTCWLSTVPALPALEGTSLSTAAPKALAQNRRPPFLTCLGFVVRCVARVAAGPSMHWHVGRVQLLVHACLDARTCCVSQVVLVCAATFVGCIAVLCQHRLGGLSPKTISGIVSPALILHRAWRVSNSNNLWCVASRPLLRWFTSCAREPCAWLPCRTLEPLRTAC
jgi:hypothetical protein